MRSDYQNKVIADYYDKIEAIMLQKLSELVTELYLSESKAPQDRLWERVDKAMVKLKVKTAIREHIMRKRDVKILAQNLNDWLRLSKKTR